MTEQKPPMHVDTWLDKPTFNKGECYAKMVLEFARMPAWKQFAFAPWMKQFKLFCDYEGVRYRVTGASRMGDVWLASDFEREDGYDKRVDVESCSNWGPTPTDVL